MAGDSGYAQQNLDATKAYQNTLARLNQQRLATLQQYGYTGQVDPSTGTLSSIAVDQHNPYGNLQQLLRQNAVQDQQAQFQAQDRGLMGGLANQMVSNLKYGHGQASAQLGSSLQDALSGYQDQQSQAAYSRDAALYAAEQQAAQNAIANGMFTQADFSGIDYPGYGDTGTDPTSPEGGAGAAKLPPDALARYLVNKAAPKRPAPAAYVHSAGANPASSKAYVAAAKIINKRKGGR